MEPSHFRTIRTVFAALLAAAATGAAIPAYASAFTVTSVTSSGITTFTITRSGSVASETVYYRTVSLSAIEGQHFTANVPGANVRIGDVSYGTIGAEPLALDLPAGVHPVEIVYPGYVAFKDRAMFSEGASFAVALVLSAEGRAALERDANFRILCERIQKSGLTDDLSRELVSRGYAKFLEASHVKLDGMTKVFVPVGAAPDLGLSPGASAKPEGAASGVGGLLEKASSILP